MNPQYSESSLDEGVLLLAHVGSDAARLCSMLLGAAISVRVCSNLGELLHGILAGPGCVLIDETCLTSKTLRSIADVLSQEPAWSQISIVIYNSGDSKAARRGETKRLLGNATFLQSPLEPPALLEAIRAALASRRTQYAARSLFVQRDRFLNTLGHELRSPLAAILLATELLKRPEAERLSAQRTIIEHQAQHIASLVDNLLDVSRILSGKVSLQRYPVDLNAVVEHSIASVDALLKARAQSLSLKLAPQGVMVEGDAMRLAQVMTNLLDNAVKFTPRGGRISVEVSYKDEAATVRVRDFGEGIAEASLSNIFELFSEGSPPADALRRGLGLGLSLVRTLVRLHGGTVHAESEGLGHGSTFTVQLPAEVQVTPEEEAPKAALPKPRRVVIIDNVAESRAQLLASVKSFGHRVEVATDGPRGLTEILAARPDIAITDVELPGIDGYEVARQVRAALGEDILLIALFSPAKTDVPLRARSAGFDVYLPKPADLETLRSLLSHGDFAPQQKDISDRESAEPPAKTPGCLTQGNLGAANTSENSC